MTVQKNSSSCLLGTLISVMSVLFYCAEFIRVEMKLNQHEERMNALEEALEIRVTTNRASDLIPNTNEKEGTSYSNQRRRRQVDSTSNKLASISKTEFVMKMNKLLSDWKLQLCQTKGGTCTTGPQGPLGPPGPRGEIGARGRRGHKGPHGKSGQQGIMGPEGLKGKTGPKGEKGNTGARGMPGIKGEPGESISAPVVIASPSSKTVNESESALFQCSVSGNPKPTVIWSKQGSQAVINGSAASPGELHLIKTTANDSGLYQCTATNILGQARGLVRLIVNVHPRVSLDPGPLYVKERSNISLPRCHVTGYPSPVVTWSGAVGQLPQGRVQRKDDQLKIFNVQKSDSDTFFCKASNLLGNAVTHTILTVVSLPKFTVRPPSKMTAIVGETLTINCSATGDPQPVIGWKRHGAQLPVERTYTINGGLLIFRDVKTEDGGTYICVAMSAGVFDLEAVTNIEVNYRDCSSLFKAGHTQSGVYSVDPDGQGAFSVYCDMRTDGGGWTVFQRRQDGSVDFYRGWNDYKSGFGQLNSEFWLGNDKIHRLTASRASSLRVELEDWSGARVYAKYGKFSIGDEQAQYRLTVGSYSGSAGDSLALHNNLAFSTKDRDHDQYRSNCAVKYTGAWWYEGCHYSNLNGQYLGNTYSNKGVVWFYFANRWLSLKFSEMKLRPSL